MKKSWIKRVVCIMLCTVLAVGGVVVQGMFVIAEETTVKKYGDADLDGKITSEDARLIMRYGVGLDQLNEGSMLFYALDVDYDEVVGASDARLVLRAAVDLETLCDEVPHKHAWGSWRTISESTCQTKGSAIRFCLYDHTHYQTKSLPLSGHTMKKITNDFVTNGYVYRAPYYQCTVCSQRFEDQAGKVKKTPEKLIPEITPITGSLKSTCESICRSYNATGVEVAVIKDGYVVNTFCYGTADKSTGRKVNEDTKYRAASLSKIATTCVFMALCDQGLVNEYDDISKYFGYKCYNPYYPNITITPWMILTHSASFIGDAGRTLQPYALQQKAYYYNIKPGTREEYSNFGFNVIACICERVTGQSFNSLAKKYLFEPLGIDASFLAYQLKDTSNLGGLYGPEGNLTPSGMLSVRPLALGVGLTLAAGNLTISAKDYAKILAMIMNDGVTVDGKRILSKQSVESMKKVRIQSTYYGLGYAMRRETSIFEGKVMYAHSGSAFGMFGGYAFCPAEHSGVVVFTSGCSRSRVTSTQLYTICHKLIKATYPYQ